MFKSEKLSWRFLRGLGLSLLLSLAVACSVGTPIGKEIVIYHTNDVHGRGLVTSDKNFDYPHLAGFLNSVREKGENFLYLDAGDAVQGVPVVGISKGLNAILLMNHLGLGAMAVGNHEFDYGIPNLRELIEQANFPVLSANVKEGGELMFEPYIVTEVDGVKFGIFGLTTPETTFKTSPKNIVGIEFADLVETSQEMVTMLRETEGVDYVIALAHVGREGDYLSTDLVEKVQGINLLIDGHDHKPLEKGLKIGDSLIIESGKHAENVGKVTLRFSEDNKIMSQTAILIPFTEIMKATPDAETQGKLEAIQASNQKLFEEIVGATPVKLEGDREIVRRGESLLGQITADALRDATNADVALMNGGGIRNSIESGDITREAVLSVFPFGNYIVTQTIDGEMLKAILEHGISKYPEALGAFPHTSGLSYTVNVEAPVGSRVSDVMVNGMPLDMAQNYTLATLDFISIGGDDYTMLAGIPLTAEFVSLDEIFTAYLGKLSPESFVFKPRILGMPK